MHIVTQLNLFSEEEILGDLEKLETILSALPDEQLIRKLEKKRKNGRNDYPVIVMWRLFLAKFIFQHDTIASLLRECRRNGQLRQLCGIETHVTNHRNGSKVMCLAPSASSMSRFMKTLMLYQDDIDVMMNQLVVSLGDCLPDFTKHLALDGKIIPSCAKQKSMHNNDGRCESQADTTAKTYAYGDKETKPKYYFGYRMHVLADTTYELPIACTVTPASHYEGAVAKTLLTQSQILLKQSRYLMADKGYDSVTFREHVEQLGMTPIIPTRKMWGEKESRQYKNTNLYYDESGRVWFCNETNDLVELMYKGYDKSTDSLRFGFHDKYNNRSVFRIKRSENRRIFSKVSQQSYKFKRLYRKRNAVERVNGRIDRDFKFENHMIRGQQKMTLFVKLSCIVMLGFAYAKATNHITTHLSSWVV